MAMVYRNLLSLTSIADVALILSGCNTLGPMFKQRDAAQPVASGSPTAEQMVAYLNDNARRLQTIQCNHVAIDCKQGQQNAPGLDGLLVVHPAIKYISSFIIPFLKIRAIIRYALTLMRVVAVFIGPCNIVS